MSAPTLVIGIVSLCIHFCGGSEVQILRAIPGNAEVGQTVTVYCGTLNDNQNISWYKRKDGRRYTIAEGFNMKRPFSTTERYSVRQLPLGFQPMALDILGVAKADEGIIGCTYNGEDAEIELHVLGRITEVFVDVKNPDEPRVRIYKDAGEVVDFLHPQPDLGYTVKCHVQANTDNISVVMKIGEEEIPAKRSELVSDPIRENPLQERIHLLHSYFDNMKAEAELNGQTMECIASTPNYPLVQVSTSVVFNVEHKPKGTCSVKEPVIYGKALTVECVIAYNPNFTYISWWLQSTQMTFDGFHQSPSTSSSYIISGPYGGTFSFTFHLSGEMEEEDLLKLTIKNPVDSITEVVRVRRPPLPTTTSTRSIAATTKATLSILPFGNTSAGAVVSFPPFDSSGDGDEEKSEELASYDEPLPPRLTTVIKSTQLSPLPARASESHSTFSPVNAGALLVHSFTASLVFTALPMLW